MNTPFKPSFKHCLRRLPSCLSATFDPLSHTTKDHLASLAELALDCHYEGVEDARLTIKQVITLKSYMKFCGREYRTGITQ